MRKRNIVFGVACVCVVLLLAGVVYGLWENDEHGLELEENAMVGIMPGVDLDQRKAELQAILDASMIAFSINTNPEFADGEAEGNLMIENPEHNQKYLTVEIYLADSEELIYQSKALKPGTYLERATLSTVLPKGQYPAIAYFKGYDLETEDYIGQTGAEIVLHIDR